MNGRGIPITGKSPMVIEIFIAIWKKSIETTPYP
jgi:hypothetical protein